MKVFCETLKKLRSKEKLTQREFALILNISPSTLAMWEIGKNQPDMNTIVKIANYFNVSTDYLLGIEDEFGNKIKPNNPETITIRTAARGHGIEEREVNKDEYLQALQKLEESRERDRIAIEELRNRLNPKK